MKNTNLLGGLDVPQVKGLTREAKRAAARNRAAFSAAPEEPSADDIFVTSEAVAAPEAFVASEAFEAGAPASRPAVLRRYREFAARVYGVVFCETRPTVARSLFLLAAFGSLFLSIVVLLAQNSVERAALAEQVEISRAFAEEAAVSARVAEEAKLAAIRAQVVAEQQLAALSAATSPGDASKPSTSWVSWGLSPFTYVGGKVADGYHYVRGDQAAK